MVTRFLLVADRTRKMNENYDVKGCVHALKQRKPSKFGLDHRLDHLTNHESFDVEFSPSGQVLRQTVYTNAMRVYRASRFTYNDARKMVRAVELDGAGLAVGISEFEYSDEGRICTTRDSKGTVTSRSVDEYAANLLTRAGTYDAEGRPKCLKSFEYSEGKLFKAISKYFGADGGLAESWFSHFDPLGRIIETFGLTPDGKPLGDGRYTYEYDDQGRKLRVLSYNDQDDTKVPNIIHGYVYKCDEKGNWIERSEFLRFINDSKWTKSVTTRELTYYPSVNTP